MKRDYGPPGGAMKFSIVTASFNSARTIAATLESVRNQTHDEIEHIVADGGSTDATAAIVRDLAPAAQLHVEPDRGIYDGMNKGLARATGEIIALLNSDDHYAHPRVIADIAALFEQTGADAVFADVAFFDPRRPDRTTRRYRSQRFSPARLRYGIMPAHPGMFLKRELYASLGPYSGDYPLSADFEFVARMFARAEPKFVFHPEVVVRMAAGGASNRNLMSKVRIFNECLRACRAHAIPTNPLVMLAKYPIKLMDYLSA